jgi:hypothetical protein
VFPWNGAVIEDDDNRIGEFAPPFGGGAEGFVGSNDAVQTAKVEVGIDGGLMFKE